MSRDDERYRDAWEDASEDDKPPARFRGDYPRSSRPNTPPRRTGRMPQEDVSARSRARQANPGNTPGRARSRQQTNEDTYGNSYGLPSPQRSRSPRQPGTRGPARESRAYDDDYAEGESAGNLPRRPRITRQNRAQVEAQRRQRQRQPIQPPYGERGKPAPARSARYNDEPYDAEPYDSYDDEERYAYAAPQRGRTMREPEYEDEYRSPRRSQPQHRHKRGRGILRSLLFIIIGALLAIALVVAGFAFFVLHNTPLGSSFGKSTYTNLQTQTLTISNVRQLLVKNQMGNVNITIDSAATSGRLTIERKVQASNTGEANTEFRRIAVNVTTINKGDDPACLATNCILISGTVPATSGGIFGSSSDIANMTITLPSSLSPSSTQPFALNASTGTGNLSATGFSGVLNLSGISGSVNITVAHGLLYAGSCIQTLSGTVTVGNNTFLDLNQASDLIPCQNTTTQNAHPWFSMKSGTGNLDVTLASQSANVLLDANTNNGQITNDFGLNIPQASDGSATFHGPLVSGTSPTASLYLSVSTGNIHLHKA